ncbi:MAG: hypothetical protein ACI9X0_003056 [Kiritimatiellia bacterium]|jgi:hypothetical protein
MNNQTSISQSGMRDQLARFALWFRLVRATVLLQWLLFAALGLASLWVFADRMLYLGGYYGLVVNGLVCVCLLVLLVAWLVYRVQPARVSYDVDQAIGSKNLVSSALQAADDSDEVSRRVVTQATSILVKRKPSDVMPMTLTWPGRYAAVPCIALIAALFIPQQDLLERKLRRDIAEHEKVRVEESAITLKATLESVQKHVSSVEGPEGDVMLQDFASMTDALSGLDKKLALQTLGEFENKHGEHFAEQRDFTKAIQNMAAATDPAGLSEESHAQLDQLQQQLKSGDLAGAADALDALADKLQDAGLSGEERKAIAREMAKLTQNMMPAGLNPNMAKQLAELASSTVDINDLVQQCEAAGADMKDLADFCKSAAGTRAMKDGLDRAKMAMLGDAFEGFDAKEVEDYLAQQALQGSASLGGQPGNGNGGTGGEGKGKGGLPPEAPTLTTFQEELSASKLHKGKILHELFVAGVPEKGEARREYADMVQAARDQAAGALARDKIPLEYETMVKTYFDSLESSPTKPSSLFQSSPSESKP